MGNIFPKKQYSNLELPLLNNDRNELILFLNDIQININNLNQRLSKLEKKIENDDIYIRDNTNKLNEQINLITKDLNSLLNNDKLLLEKCKEIEDKCQYKCQDKYYQDKNNQNKYQNNYQQNNELINCEFDKHECLKTSINIPLISSFRKDDEYDDYYIDNPYYSIDNSKKETNSTLSNNNIEETAFFDYTINDEDSL
jgi:hypothetical protein